MSEDDYRIAQARMEGKLDQALADHGRRLFEGEEARRDIYRSLESVNGRVTDTQSSLRTLGKVIATALPFIGLCLTGVGLYLAYG